MKKTVKRVKSQKKYDLGLKRRLAKSYLAGEASYGALAQEHGLKNRDVVKEFVKWYRRILAEEQIDIGKVKDKKENKPQKDLSDLSKEELLALLKIEESRKKDAEMRAEFFETMIDIAEKRYNIPIKKKNWHQAVASIRGYYDDVALSKICSYACKSRQSYYQGLTIRQERIIQWAIIVDLVIRERRIAKRVSARKLYLILKEELEGHNIKIGRDKFYDVLRDNGLLVYRKKRRPKTTDSNHELPLYPNRAKNYEIDRSEQLWVSDITYVWVGTKWCYLVLITDSYSRKVVGWNFGKKMTAEFCHEALDKAIKERKHPDRKLMHHSDRGSQYCSKLYTKKLTENEIEISMTENGDPLENPLAERMNRTFKYEFAMDEGYSNFEKAFAEVGKAINYYNTRLPHSSVDMLTPEAAHEKQGPLKKHWRWYWREAQENLEQNFYTPQFNHWESSSFSTIPTA